MSDEEAGKAKVMGVENDRHTDANPRVPLFQHSVATRGSGAACKRYFLQRVEMPEELVDHGGCQRVRRAQPRGQRSQGDLCETLGTRAMGGGSLRESPFRERRCTRLADKRGGRAAGRCRRAQGKRGRERAAVSTRERDVAEALQRFHADRPAEPVVTAGSAGVHCPEEGPAADGRSKPTSGGWYRRDEAMLAAQLLEDGHL